MHLQLRAAAAECDIGVPRSACPADSRLPQLSVCTVRAVFSLGHWLPFPLDSYEGTKRRRVRNCLIDVQVVPQRRYRLEEPFHGRKDNVCSLCRRGLRPWKVENGTLNTAFQPSISHLNTPGHMPVQPVHCGILHQQFAWPDTPRTLAYLPSPSETPTYSRPRPTRRLWSVVHRLASTRMSADDT